MYIKYIVFLIATLFFCAVLFAEDAPELQYLKQAYPDTLHDVSTTHILWKNGQQLEVRDSLSLFEKFIRAITFSDTSTKDSISVNDLHCDHYELFFKKMYGGTAHEVERNLVTVYWMPKVFGKRYPLLVTSVNGVDKKLKRISTELEKLPKSYHKFLNNPGGSFYWRNVARESYLSSHSFGIAIDINSHYGNYWLWDMEKVKHPFSRLTLHNNIPMKIVNIFEQEGFLWGGRWYFYDTMHFEYRPEMFMRTADNELRYNNSVGLRCGK